MPNRFITARYGQVVALPAQTRRRAGMQSPLAGTNWRDTVCRKLIERRLMRAYLLLLFMPACDDGTKTVSLARFGPYEVRLIEFEPQPSPDMAPLWLELYAHDIRCSLDSCGCDAIDDAVDDADDLVARVRELHQQAEQHP